MASGIDVAPECSDVLDRIKSRKQRFCLLKISEDNKHIVVEHESEDDHSIGEECKHLVDLKASAEESECCSEKALISFATMLKKDPEEPRYCYFNYVCCKDGRTIDKMVLFLYNSDHAKIKKKMLYSSSKDALKKVITTTFIDYHFTDIDDLLDFKSMRSDIMTKSGST